MNQAITIPELKAEETFDTYTIKEVKRYDSGWTITTTSSTSFGIADDSNPKKLEPRPGQTVRLYPGGFRQICGVDLAGEEVFFLTPAEREAQHLTVSAKIDREWRESYARDRAKYAEQTANLPDPLRRRMERFKGDPNFWKSEGYELFCCTEAAWLVEYLRPKLHRLTPREAVEWFRSLKGDEQLAAGMSEEHSGNTFRGMCRLALAVLENRDV